MAEGDLLVWDGTESWQIFEDYFILTATGFDANAEYSSTFDLKEKLGYIPSQYSIYAVRTGGATDLINVRWAAIDHATTSWRWILQLTDSRGPQYILSSHTNYGATEPRN